MAQPEPPDSMLSRMVGQFEYDGILLTDNVTSPTMIDGVRKLRLTAEDTVVVAYPKAGSTWLKYLAYLVLHNADEEGHEAPINQSDVRYLEFRFPGEDESDVLKMFAEKPLPRLFNTHLHFSHLQKQVTEDKAKVILLTRNPKDILVSYYHYYRSGSRASTKFTGNWDDFFELFKRKQIWGGDVFDFYVEWWKVKDDENVLVVTYEEMKSDLVAFVRKVARFLRRGDLCEEVIQEIARRTSFSQMKSNSRVNGSDLAEMGILDFSTSEFLRKGVVGDWKNFFSGEQSLYVDKICEERCAPIGLTFQPE